MCICVFRIYIVTQIEPLTIRVRLDTQMHTIEENAFFDKQTSPRNVWLEDRED